MPATVATFSPAVQRFLATPRRYAVIATVAPDGWPRQAVVWYRLDAEGLLINSRVGRSWPADLERDPRISFVVHDEGPRGDREDYVSMRAEAVVVATGAQALEDIQDLARRYGSDPEQFAGQERITFRLRPLKVWTHGEIE